MKMILTLSVISIVISACGDNETSVTEHVVAPEIAIMPNLSPPVINNIVVPDQIHAGGRITLQAFAEDPDRNGMEYHWEAPGKLIYTKIHAIATWIPPPMHYFGRHNRKPHRQRRHTPGHSISKCQRPPRLNRARAGSRRRSVGGHT